MYWIKEMQSAIGFIEGRLTQELYLEDIARSANSSNANFQRIFSIVTGMTAGDYIRSRRLSLAGQELVESDVKVLDIALKYGYETAESFTKAFTRFHGVTPSVARQQPSTLQYFHSLSINIDIRGGFNMRRKIIPNFPNVDYNGNEVDYDLNLLAATFAGAGEAIDRAELAVYSGMANRFVWKPNDWRHGYEVLDSIDQTPFETMIRLLKTFGWDAKYVNVLRDSDGKPLNTDSEQIRRDFVDSIDNGYPILHHMGNHKNSKFHRPCVTIGYEHDGSVIITKSGLDGEDAYNEKFSETITHENWEEAVSAYVILKSKAVPLPERERFLELLKLIVSRARMTDKINGMHVGFAAWEAYLHDIEFSDFSHVSPEEVGARMGIYCDGLCQIWGRNAVLPYYRSLAKHYPEWRKELKAAVAALESCAKYGGYLWEIGFSMDDFKTDKFADLAMRKKLADEGRRAMQKDMEAIEQFERILSLS
ncbi:MAG: helix-turn-helix transcriptional regulator [Oscillospiraceae bacterium]|nr:helix-turn-helix transcriptional regulator [Oscillospiraceae bacterium]